MPPLVGDVKSVIGSAGVLHATRTTLVARNLLRVLIIANGVLALGYHATTLLNTTCMNFVGLIEFAKFLVLRLQFDAFAIPFVAVGLNVTALHF